ncbi:MAG: hypothetical protein O2861_11950, partial [Proteobacteria bacterium]|nr:hypothetical protein [Pseudomonadota bacterium]
SVKAKTSKTSTTTEEPYSRSKGIQANKQRRENRDRFIFFQKINLSLFSLSLFSLLLLDATTLSGEFLTKGTQQSATKSATNSNSRQTVMNQKRARPAGRRGYGIAGRALVRNLAHRDFPVDCSKWRIAV